MGRLNDDMTGLDLLTQHGQIRLFKRTLFDKGQPVGFGWFVEDPNAPVSTGFMVEAEARAHYDLLVKQAGG